MNPRSRSFAIAVCAQVAATGVLFALYGHLTGGEPGEQIGALSLIAIGAFGCWFFWQR